MKKKTNLFFKKNGIFKKRQLKQNSEFEVRGINAWLYTGFY